MIGAIIQARMGSTRLPGKVLLDICGQPVLWHVYSRVCKSKTLDRVIVATTTNPEDDIIEQYCLSKDIPVYRGSANDVLDRYYQCAKKNGIDIIVRITADCPLHDAQVIDFVVNEYLKGEYDYVTNTFEYSFPDGLDAEVFGINTLTSAWESATLPSEREHVTPFIRNSLWFTKKNVFSPKSYPLYRLTLDQPEDYEFINKIYEGIGKTEFSLDMIIDYLASHTGLLKINQDIVRNEGYIRAMITDAKNSRIKGSRIYLRGLKESDASDTYLSWLNDPVVNSHIETKQATAKELKEYIREKDEHYDCIFFGIFLNEGDRHIGNVKIEPINYANDDAGIGIILGDKTQWGKGLCLEAVNLSVDYIFQRMHLKRVYLGVLSDNDSAIRCFTRAGFSVEKTDPILGKNSDNPLQQLIMSIYNLKDGSYQGVP